MRSILLITFLSILLTACGGGGGGGSSTNIGGGTVDTDNATTDTLTDNTNPGTDDVATDTDDDSTTDTDVTETLPKVVLDNGAVGADWEQGLVAFDEDINWQTCENDGGEGCRVSAGQLSTMTIVVMYLK